MRHSSTPFARRLCSGALLCAVLAGSGCSVGRSWFQMDSNSSTPWLGFDLTPRWTSQLTPPTGDESLLPTDESGPPIRTASHKPPVERGWKRLNLPVLGTGAEEIDITHTSAAGTFLK